MKTDDGRQATIAALVDLLIDLDVTLAPLAKHNYLLEKNETAAAMLERWRAAPPGMLTDGEIIKMRSRVEAMLIAANTVVKSWGVI